MIKTPAKFRKPMTNELKKFIVHVQTLAAKGKTATEEDARIIINDILAYVLGYDKYNDLKTEFKDKNNRLDYVVKLSEGPNAKKKDKHDFVIEAKSTSVDLKQDHVNQTLTYCLNSSVDFFILTNAREWKLYKVINLKSKKEAELIWETNLNNGSDIETLVDEMYVLSKHAYLESRWNDVADINKATDVADVMAVIYSDKFIKSISRTLREVHNVKVSDETLQEVVANEIFKDFSKLNKSLLKKLNSTGSKTKTEDKIEQEHSIECFINETNDHELKEIA